MKHSLLVAALIATMSAPAFAADVATAKTTEPTAATSVKTEAGAVKKTHKHKRAPSHKAAAVAPDATK